MKTAFNLLFALLLFAASPLTLSAEMYKVLNWRGNVKIAGRAPVKNQSFSSTAKITFEKTSDALIVLTERKEVKSIVPKSFAQKESNAKKCTTPDCQPMTLASRVVAGTQHEFYTAFVQTLVAQFETPVVAPQKTTIPQQQFQKITPVPATPAPIKPVDKVKLPTQTIKH